eukprot:scaffold227_cov165-Amphora_coffeaeformis.AAC.6
MDASLALAGLSTSTAARRQGSLILHENKIQTHRDSGDSSPVSLKNKKYTNKPIQRKLKRRRNLVRAVKQRRFRTWDRSSTIQSKL